MSEIEHMDRQETNDWRLSCVIKWKQRRFMTRIACPTCSGSGKIGGGWNDPSEPRECQNCYGCGSVVDPNDTPLEPAPAIPKDLIEHMQKAWKAYFSK
jgi:hypothetical protein